MFLLWIGQTKGKLAFRREYPSRGVSKNTTCFVSTDWLQMLQWRTSSFRLLDSSVPIPCIQFVNVNSVLEFRVIGTLLGVWQKLRNKELSFLIYFPRSDSWQTKIFKDVHEINDITIDMNLVLASDVTETMNEAFEEEDDVAVWDSDQESRGNTAKILLGSVMVLLWTRLVTNWNVTR